MALSEYLTRCVEQAMKKPDRPGDGVREAVWGKPCEVMELCPQITEWLITRLWDDHSQRVPSTFLLLAEDGVFKLMCNDKDANRTLWVSARTISEAFFAMEAKLADPLADWRAGRQAGTQDAAKRQGGSGHRR